MSDKLVEMTAAEIAGRRVRIETCPSPSASRGQDTICSLVNADGSATGIRGVMSVSILVPGRQDRVCAALTMRDGTMVEVDDVQLGTPTP